MKRILLTLLLFPLFCSAQETDLIDLAFDKPIENKAPFAIAATITTHYQALNDYQGNSYLGDTLSVHIQSFNKDGYLLGENIDGAIIAEGTRDHLNLIDKYICIYAPFLDRWNTTLRYDYYNEDENTHFFNGSYEKEHFILSVILHENTISKRLKELTGRLLLAHDIVYNEQNQITLLKVRDIEHKTEDTYTHTYNTNNQLIQTIHHHTIVHQYLSFRNIESTKTTNTTYQYEDRNGHEWIIITQSNSITKEVIVNEQYLEKDRYGNWIRDFLYAQNGELLNYAEREIKYARQ